MTRQTTLHERPNQTIDHLPRHDWSEAMTTVSDFATEPHFINTLQQAGVDPTDHTTPEYAEALSLYAKDYQAAYGDSGLVDPATLEQITLIANTPHFIHAQNTITHLETKKRHTPKHRLPQHEYAEYLRAKKDAVEYNQQLSGYIYDHPEDTMSAIDSSLTDFALSHFPRHEQEIDWQITSTTRGARTEAVTRHLLDLFQVDYRAGTGEEDLRGADIILYYRGHAIKVDLKASLDKVAKVRGGYDELVKQQITYAVVHDYRDKGAGSIVIFPGFTDGELGDNCHFDGDIAQQKAIFLATQLERAAKEAVGS